tara:strand:+ start:5017 stop:6339 length:1323 start_codon:yes stop_codon:yes gene_type:complete
MGIEAIEERYRELTPESRELFEEGREVNAGAAKGAYYYAPYPLTFRRGSGCELDDVDGRTYVDFGNHHTAQVLGHNHPAVVIAVRSQLSDGIALGGPMGVETKIAKHMCDRVSSLDRIRFVNSGTEASLHAIRLARQFSGKPKVAKFEGGYHGSHDAVEVSVSPNLEDAGDPREPKAVATAGGMAPHSVDDTIVLPYDDEESLERLLSRHREDLACVIMDPKAGILPQRPEFVRRVRDVTRDLGMIMIFDEIVGFRQARGGLQSHYEIEPDLTCFGKIIGGGFPVGAFGGRADLMDQLDNSKGSSTVFQSGTHSAHAVAMAAGLATLEQLTDDAHAHLNGLGSRLKTGLDKLFGDRGVVAHVVVMGSVFSIHFGIEEVRTYRDMASADKETGLAVFMSLLNQGFFLSQGLGMCAISLPTEGEHIDALVEAIGIALDEIED